VLNLHRLYHKITNEKILKTAIIYTHIVLNGVQLSIGYSHGILIKLFIKITLKKYLFIEIKT